MADTNDNQAPVTPPNSIAQASVDEKGRLKFPSEFLGYLDALGITKVFITTLDLRLGRIYPMDRWFDNLKVLESSRQNPAAAQRLAFTAKVYGGEAEIDKSGRVLVPAKLRDRLEISKGPIWLEAFQDRINLVTQAEFDKRMAEVEKFVASDLEALEEEGFQ